MPSIARTKINDFIADTHGLIFTATFIKKDGSLRTMNCRKGVRKHLVGGTNKVVDLSNGYIVVYDLKSKGYRTLNLDTVQQIRFAHSTFDVL